MKIKALILICLSLLSLQSKAQNNNDDVLNSRIVLSVVMPQNEEKISSSNYINELMIFINPPSLKPPINNLYIRLGIANIQ